MTRNDNRLWILIKKRGLAQIDVAKSLGVVPETVCRWCCDKHKPRRKTRGALAATLSISEWELETILGPKVGDKYAQNS